MGKKNSSAMSKINRVYDIKKIDDYGNFSKNYSWPISYKFSHRIVSKVIKRILPIIENSDTTLSESLKVFRKWFLSEIIRWFYATSLLSAFESQKINVDLSKDYEKYNMLKKGKISKNSILITFFNYESKFKFIPSWLKETVLNIRKNKSFYLKQKYSFFPSDLCYNQEKIEKIFLKNLHPSRFFDPIDKYHLEKKVNFKNDEKELIKEILSTVEKIFLSEHQKFDPIIIKYLRKWLSISKNFFLFHCKNLMKKNFPNEIWISSIGSNTISSMLAYCAFQQGVKIVAHDHGNGDAYHEQLANHLFEYNYCTHFFTYSKNQALIKSQALKKEVNCKSKKVQPKFIYKENKKKLKNKILSKKINKIMYLSTAFHAERVRFRPILLDYQYLDWQIRLLQFLSKNNEVYYKSHPDRFQVDVDKLKKKNIKKVYKKNFENCGIMVDCYIVDFISSSTTKLILKSDAVVIYLNPGHPKLSSIAYNLLKKRCHILNIYENNFNRLDLNWKKLNSILKKKKHLINHEFSNYFFD